MNRVLPRLTLSVCALCALVSLPLASVSETAAHAVLATCVVAALVYVLHAIDRLMVDLGDNDPDRTLADVVHSRDVVTAYAELDAANRARAALSDPQSVHTTIVGKIRPVVRTKASA